MASDAVMTASEAADAAEPSSESGPPDEADGSRSAVDGPLSLDITFELLKNARRRAVMRHLQSTAGSVTIGTLAEQLAARENDKPVESIRSSERKRVYIGLYQCHLPKMDDAGVIAFDRDRGTVEPADRLSHVTRYLDPDGQTEADAETSAHDWYPASLAPAVLVTGGLLGYFLVSAGLVGATLMLALVAAFSLTPVALHLAT